MQKYELILINGINDLGFTQGERVKERKVCDKRVKER